MKLRKPDPIEILKARVGQPLPPTRWFQITQAMIDAHAETHQDWQYIHVDPVKAAETPFGGTIAHGFLTLGMLSAMVYDTDLEPEDMTLGLNYGFNKLRFLAPVKAGARIRGHFTPQAVTVRGPGEVLQTNAVSVEIEGEEKPALVAEWLNLYVFETPQGDDADT